MKQVKLRRGEVSANRSSELLALKFKDKRDVTMLSTIHNKKWFEGEEMQPTKNQNAFQITTSIWGCGSHRSVATAI